MADLSHRQSRRTFLKSTALSLGTAATAGSLFAADAKEELPPVRTITRGPKFHWFAYYDKLQFDPAVRYALSNEVDFEHRSPKADDTIKVGMVDLEDNDRWIELGKTQAWCWQQGCMLQWRPGSKSEVLWNDREEDRFVCHVLDVKTGEKRTIPHPIYTVSPCGKWAVSPDFRRVNDMRPGYGYAGLPDPNKEKLAPEDSGIFRVDLDTGEQTLLLSLAQIAKIPFDKYDLTGAKHYFNHLLVSPDGSRFEFLHRWRMEGLRSFGTRMLTAAADGSDVRVIDPSGYTSHFIWRDPDHILAWSRADSHGGRLLPLRGPPGRQDRGGRQRRNAPQRSLHLFAGERVDSQRHLSRRKEARAESLSLPRRHGAPHTFGPFCSAHGVPGRVALRHPPTIQPRRQAGLH